MNFSGRRKRAVAAAKAAGVEALLVTHLADVRYLCGFTGSNAALVLVFPRQTMEPSDPSTSSGQAMGHPVRGRVVLFTDGRYGAQAKAEAPGVRVVIEKKSAAAAACAWMAAAGLRRCGFDAAQTTVAVLAAMRAAVAAGRRRGMFVAVAAVVSRLREVKDADEIAKIRAAAALGCRLFEGLLSVMQPGMAETAVAAELEYKARLAGAEGMSFETIVAGGVRSSMPHGKASAAKLPRRGFCTLDFGVVLEGYLSDMTRTVHLGRALPGEREAYEAVLEAQEAGVAAVRAGVAAGDVDEAARSVLRRAGMEEAFSHSTGHGVGLEIHEGPRVAAKQEQRLEAGMVITIEPGVYLPGKFGVRIEDMVLVTRPGSEILTPVTKAWIEL